MATGVRIGWHDLPGHVRAAVEDVIRDEVVEAVSQPGGFSPGTADRVRTRDGRAFVKAVSPALNALSVDMHRQEARVTAALPAEAPVSRLLGAYDDGEWVALVLADVEGRHPATPWRTDELAAVLTSLNRLTQALTPSPIQDLPETAGRCRTALDSGAPDGLTARRRVPCRVRRNRSDRSPNGYWH